MAQFILMFILIGPDDLKKYKHDYGAWNSKRFNAMIVPLEEALTDEQKFKIREARRQFESENLEPPFFPNV
jgi:hypothetical protein